MKFMLLQDYAPTEGAAEFIGAWSPEDAAAHIELAGRSWRGPHGVPRSLRGYSRQRMCRTEPPAA
jgi:hypothetical protein